MVDGSIQSQEPRRADKYRDRGDTTRGGRGSGSRASGDRDRPDRGPDRLPARRDALIRASESAFMVRPDSGLCVVPARKELHLSRATQVVKTAPFDWTEWIGSDAPARGQSGGCGDGRSPARHGPAGSAEPRGRPDRATKPLAGHPRTVPRSGARPMQARRSISTAIKVGVEGLKIICAQAKLPLICSSARRKANGIWSGAVAQLVRAPPCHGGGCGFEPRRFRQIPFVPREERP